MANYDEIDEQIGQPIIFKDEELTDREIYYLFQQACRLCRAEDALQLGLKMYFQSQKSRLEILNLTFVVCLADKGLSDPKLFPQIYQLLCLNMANDGATKEWKKCEDFSKYEVSSFGEIRLIKGNKPVVPDKNNLVKLGRKAVKLDYLVASAFLSNAREHTGIDHLNDDLLDNRMINLKWVPEEEVGRLKKGKKPPWGPIWSPGLEALSTDPDRLSYVYRFALAVWLVASAESSRVNAWAAKLFSRDIRLKDSKDDEDFGLKFGSPEDNHGELIASLQARNIANCLYYTRILSIHPARITGKVQNTSIRDAYIYIWDAFDYVVANYPEHIKVYLEKMREVGLSAEWQSDIKSRLLYSHFIHMYCLDPIVANLKKSGKGRAKKRVATAAGMVEGEFVSDFDKRAIAAGLAKKKEEGGQFQRTADIDYVLDPLLFPVDKTFNYLVEPRDDSVPLQYGVDGEETEFPDFVPVFEEVASGDVDIDFNEYKLENFNSITAESRAEHISEYWEPLSIFYLYFNYYNTRSMTEIEKLYGTPEKFFLSKEYPNPFDLDSDITQAEYLSFLPFIKEKLGVVEKSPHRVVLPREKRALKDKSTFVFRTVSGNVTSIKVTIGKRQPIVAQPENTTPTIRAPARVRAGDLKPPTPKVDKETKKESVKIKPPSRATGRTSRLPVVKDEESAEEEGSAEEEPVNIKPHRRAGGKTSRKSAAKDESPRPTTTRKFKVVSNT